MKITFNSYATVDSGITDIYDVHFIIIDEEQKTIECNDTNGMAIGTIFYEECEECAYLPMDNYDRLTGERIIIVKNGRLVI